MIVFITLGWISTLTRSHVVLSLKSWQWILERKRPIQPFYLLESILQPATQYSKVTMSFLLCFLSKPSGRGSVLCVFQCISKRGFTCMWPFSVMSDLHRGSKAAGLAFSYLLLNPRSHVSALASSRFLTDHKASLCSLSPSCHWCSLRHYHLGCMSGKGKICCSTSRKQLEEEKSGTPYSRSRGGGHRWDWWQLLELVMCVVCFQLSQGVWL